MGFIQGNGGRKPRRPGRGPGGGCASTHWVGADVEQGSGAGRRWERGGTEEWRLEEDIARNQRERLDIAGRAVKGLGFIQGTGGRQVLGRPRRGAQGAGRGHTGGGTGSGRLPDHRRSSAKPNEGKGARPDPPVAPNPARANRRTSRLCADMAPRGNTISRTK